MQTIVLMMTGWLTISQTGAPAEQVAQGAKVYAAQRCAACHSIAGQGNKRSPLDGVGKKLGEEQLRKWVVAPREMDPKVRKRAYDKLPRQDLDALVAYLQSLQ